MNKEKKFYELIIIGGGPAGTSAGVYAARKHLNTLFVTESFGGQSIVSPAIENWIGFPKISGNDLAKSFENHLRAYADGFVDIKTGSRAKKVEKTDVGFKLILENDEEFEAKAIMIATGSHRRKIQAVNADTLEHKGLTYCASCDGPIFAGKDVAIIGGGNAGFETASQLLAYAKSVTLLHHSDKFKADAKTVAKVSSHPNMKTIINADTKEILGQKFVEGLIYKDLITGEEKELKVKGIFVEIGATPTTNFVSGLVELNQYNQIVVDPINQRTSVDGIWAAGDCTNGLYHQNNIAAGDAVKALEDAYLFLNAK